MPYLFLRLLTWFWCHTITRITWHLFVNFKISIALKLFNKPNEVFVSHMKMSKHT